MFNIGYTIKMSHLSHFSSLNGMYVAESQSFRQEKSVECDSFLKGLSSISQDVKRIMGTEQFLLLQQVSAQLKAYLEQPNQSFQSTADLAIQFLDKLDADFLEEFVDDLKNIRKKNRQASLKDIIDVKQHIVGFIHTKSTKQSSAQLHLGQSSHQQHINPHEDDDDLTSLKSFDVFSFSSQSMVSPNTTLLVVNRAPQQKKELTELEYSLSHCGFQRLRFDVISDLKPDQIIEMITGILDAGLTNIDDLQSIMKLVNQLSFGDALKVMANIERAIQEFLDQHVTMTTDPLEIFMLITLISEFTQQIANQDLDMSFAEMQVSNLIALTDVDHQKKMEATAASLGINIEVLPDHLNKDIVNSHAFIDESNSVDVNSTDVLDITRERGAGATHSQEIFGNRSVTSNAGAEAPILKESLKVGDFAAVSNLDSLNSGLKEQVNIYGHHQQEDGLEEEISTEKFQYYHNEHSVGVREELQLETVSKEKELNDQRIIQSQKEYLRVIKDKQYSADVKQRQVSSSSFAKHMAVEQTVDDDSLNPEKIHIDTIPEPDQKQNVTQRVTAVDQSLSESISDQKPHFPHLHALQQQLEEAFVDDLLMIMNKFYSKKLDESLNNIY